MLRVLAVVVLLVIAVSLTGCGQETKDRRLDLSGLLRGWTYHSDSGHNLLLDYAGATFTSAEVADILTGVAKLASGKKVTWYRHGDEQFFIPYDLDQDVLAREQKLILRFAHERLDELEGKLDGDYTLTSAVDSKENVKQLSLLENLDPPAPLVTKLPPMWWENDRNRLKGVASDVLEGLTFEYRCSTGDDWRIDSYLLAYGAHRLSAHDLYYEGAVPDIVVTWTKVRNGTEGISLKEDHDIRLTFRTRVVRDLARWGGEVDGISFKTAVAAAFRDIADARVGKKVAAYRRLDAGDMAFIETTERAIKMMSAEPK